PRAGGAYRPGAWPAADAPGPRGVPAVLRLLDGEQRAADRGRYPPLERHAGAAARHGRRSGLLRVSQPRRAGRRRSGALAGGGGPPGGARRPGGLTGAAYRRVGAAFRARYSRLAGYAQNWLFYDHFRGYWGGASPLLK